MNLKIKNTNYVIVLLVTLFISGHELIPHHHHYDSIYSHSSPYENKKHKDSESHNSGNPENHCHALNDLLYDRSIQDQFFLLTAPIHFILDFTECYLAIFESKHAHTYKLANHPLPDLIRFSDPLHFRGPPLF